MDLPKLIRDLRAEIKNLYPEYTEKEISAYIAGMIAGVKLCG